MIASIHQPNFLPWVGFFNKILRSDVYVVFDDVQFPRGKDFAYRNKIKINNGTKWLSVPISNKSQLVPWNKAQISKTNWKTDHINSIHEAYRQSTHFETVFDELTKIYDNEYEYIIDLNLDFIKLILSKFNWNGQIIKSSDLNINSTGLTKITDILQHLNITEYITGEGAGSKRYIEDHVFQELNIKLTYQNFNERVYTQLYGDFTSNLSIIDLLFNEGFDSKEIII